MRRLSISVLAAALALLTLSSVTLAAKPSTGCPSGASGWFLTDRDLWWDITVAGFVTEGIPVYVGGDPENGYTEAFDAFAEAAGFGDGAGLEYFVRVTQWAAFDHNDDGLTCMKYRPHTPGNPAYFFGGVDNQSSSPLGQMAL